MKNIFKNRMKIKNYLQFMRYDKQQKFLGYELLANSIKAKQCDSIEKHK